MLQYFRHLGAGVLLSLPLIATGCDNKPEPTPPPAPPVTVAQPTRQDAIQYLEFSGVASAVEDVGVKSRVSGAIDAVLFTEGDPVSVETVLYQIDPRSLEASLQKAQADLQTSRVRYQNAAINHTRYLELYQDQVVSEAEYDQVRTQYLSASQEVAANEALVAEAQVNLSYAQVRAPINGRVGETLVTEGNVISANMTTLTRIFTYNPVYVSFDLSERELLNVRSRLGDQRAAGSMVVQVGPLDSSSFPHEGIVNFGGLGVDPDSGTYLVRATVQNPPPHLILPGQFMRVRFALDTIEDALLIPERALGLDQGGRYVLTVGPDNNVVQRHVTLGPQQDGGMVVVSEGISAEDRIIVDGLQRARPGSPVTPQMEGSAAAPAPSGGSGS